MKARLLVGALLFAGAGCHYMASDQFQSSIPVVAGPQARQPVTPDMVTEENGHAISQELLEELDREGKR